MAKRIKMVKATKARILRREGTACNGLDKIYRQKRKVRFIAIFDGTGIPRESLIDAPRDKRTYFREINYIAAAFQYQKKNYNSA